MIFFLFGEGANNKLELKGFFCKVSATFPCSYPILRDQEGPQRPERGPASHRESPAEAINNTRGCARQGRGKETLKIPLKFRDAKFFSAGSGNRAPEFQRGDIRLRAFEPQVEEPGGFAGGDGNSPKTAGNLKVSVIFP